MNRDHSGVDFLASEIEGVMYEYGLDICSMKEKLILDKSGGQFLRQAGIKFSSPVGSKQ